MMTIPLLALSFTAGYDNRPFANDQPGVMALVKLQPFVAKLEVHTLVYQGVKYLQYSLTDCNGVRYKGRVVKQPAQSL